jgi:hypothetical protein
MPLFFFLDLERCNAVDRTFSDQNGENFLIYEIPDEELEMIGMEKANAITQWLCTALNFCHGP